MAHESIDSLVIKELIVKTIRGNTELILAGGGTFTIKDTTGFERFKIEMGTGKTKKTKMFFNGKQVMR